MSSISRVLKPKSPKQVLSDFAERHHISPYELSQFMKDFRHDIP